MSQGGSHYFHPEPAAPSARRLVPLQVGERRLDLWTDTGVFSGSHLDPGTQALLEEAPAPPDGPGRQLMDLGCGYGPIAVSLALRAPAAEVWAVDVNLRALDLARENAELSGVELKTVTPDRVPERLCFDAIYSNPPVRIGKEALHGLLLTWLGRLKPEGRAYLVVLRHLGSDSLARWLAEEQGFAVARLASKRGYRILEVRG